MNIVEFAEIMVKKGAVIRAIPMVEESLMEARHLSDYKGREGFSAEIVEDERFNRPMLRVRKNLSLGGKFLVTFKGDQMDTVHFSNAFIFDSLDDAIEFVRHYKEDITIGGRIFKIGSTIELIKDGEEKKIRGILHVKLADGVLHPLLRLSPVSEEKDFIPICDSDFLVAIPSLWGRW